jgi:hypothetical protein
MSDWKRTLGSMGFRPHGPFGAMRVWVEDVEYIAIPHPLRGLSIMVTHVSPRIAAQFETFVPLDASAAQIAAAMVDAFEEIHPERKGDP